MMRCVILALLLATSSSLVGQSVKPPSPADKKFDESIMEVRRLLSQQQFEGALAKLREAEAIKPESSVVYNARGNVYTSMKDYGQARKAYLKAEELRPGGFETRFNLAELDYVEGNYEAAAASFGRLLTNPANVPPQAVTLAQFKIVVCELKLNRAVKADGLIKTYGWQAEGAASYFANAAVAVQKGDHATANRWLADAQKKFKPGEIVPYVDALVEAGWLKMPGAAGATKQP